MFKHAVAAAVLTGLTLAAPVSDAQAGYFTTPHTGDRPVLLELHAGLSYVWVGPAVGARVKFPILKNGFVPSVNNAVHITVGADLYATFGFYNGFGVGVPVTMAWDFYFTEQFSAFADVGANVFIHSYYFENNSVPVGAVLRNWLMYGVGGRYHLNEKTALMFRAGAPYLAVGVEFSL